MICGLYNTAEPLEVVSTNTAMCDSSTAQAFSGFGRFNVGLFALGDSMKRIPLTQGKFSLVDDEDYEGLMKHKWYARKDGHTFYAIRHAPGIAKRQDTLLMHRVILGLPKGVIADHINGNGLDNRRSNLRYCTHAENMHNQQIRRRNKSSYYKGVHWQSKAKRWNVQICLLGKRLYLGLFKDEKEAARAYDRAARERFGKFARCNFGKE